MTSEQHSSDFERRCRAAGIHTVEVAAPDTLGHLRGKRIPIDRFFATTVDDGVNIADAMFVFDSQNDLVDDPYINMGSGFLDCKLIPDVSTGRLLTHRPGYAIVLADTFDPHGAPHPHSPRSILANQIERCRELELDPVVATELEFYLCTPDWKPVQQHIQYSSLTDALEIETVLAEMRAALLGADLEVESSNAEYGAGQFEINIGHADAMTAADNTVLFKSIVKQVAVQHGLRATFMPKPFAEQSGSGMHVHTSLKSDGANAFADSDGAPNQLMGHWIAGLLQHARSMGLIASPTANGVKRVQPYTFCPTHVHWGLDNRTVLVRCIVEAGSRANRVEFRAAGADANPYLLVGSILAAGADGVENSMELPAMSVGDMYGEPGDCAVLPNSLPDAIEAFEAGDLGAQLGEKFATSYVGMARHEHALGVEHAPDPEDVNDWERLRYAEHC
ncbi:MAG: glutamine synthetase family protein [Ilumatobacter sp.]|uniref:glutamine synthetase family protein n=1 Tax=Ilumatobacter sp. TaxID=1967498 RepID=UPI003C72F1C8